MIGGDVAEDEWYYCLDHQKVEPKEQTCRSINRFGPYESYEAAEHALDRVAERNEEWDRQDREDD